MIKLKYMILQMKNKSISNNNILQLIVTIIISICFLRYALKDFDYILFLQILSEFR